MPLVHRLAADVFTVIRAITTAPSMAGYVPHNTKKRERLARLEHDLMRSIRSGNSREHQLDLADEVRLGRIKVLRAERAKFVAAASGHSDRIAAINGQIASLEAIASEEILAEFLARLGHISAKQR